MSERAYIDYDAILESFAEGRCEGPNDAKAIAAKVLELLAENEALREDAEKWRALMSCERIRIMGRTMDYNHIGVEFWMKHRAAHPCAEFPQEECRDHLGEFVRRLTEKQS
jgi:hypothetical protein